MCDYFVKCDLVSYLSKNGQDQTEILTWNAYKCEPYCIIFALVVQTTQLMSCQANAPLTSSCQQYQADLNAFIYYSVVYLMALFADVWWFAISVKFVRSIE